jgi:hypothetical protein
MPVIPINTPNLVADQAQIAAFILAIEALAPTTLNTFFTPCWALKPSGDCDALILTDVTDYNVLDPYGVPINIDDITISSNFGPVSDCGCEIVTDECQSGTLLPNSITTYDQLMRDGKFCAELTITFGWNPVPDDPDNPLTYYTEVIKVAYEVDCCTKKYRELAYNIWGKMADISCQINCLVKVGRNVKKLKESYLELSNLLWLYYNSIDSCNERDKVFCIFNKIK